MEKAPGSGEKGPEAIRSPEVLQSQTEFPSYDGPASDDADSQTVSDLGRFATAHGMTDAAAGDSVDTTQALGAYAIDGATESSANQPSDEAVHALGRLAIDASTPVEPPEEASPSSYASVDGFGSAELADRIDAHHPQGANSVEVLDRLGGATQVTFEGTCGIASGAQALSDATGAQVSEQDVLEAALRNPELSGTVDQPPSVSNPELWGGTTQFGRDEIYRSFGVETDVGKSWDVQQLADTVESGDSVLATVNSSELWKSGSPGRDAGTDHVVYVVGTERTADGQLTGFIVNDTGLPGNDGAGVSHDLNTFAAAWEDRGGKVNVIKARESNGT